MKPEEKVQLFSDIAVIKEKLTNMDKTHESMLKDMKPAVRLNTRFRLMITGFICIALPLVTFAMRYK